MSYLGDVISLETTDGIRQNFIGTPLVITAYGNFGAPPIEWITSRGYKQHGETVLDYMIESRVVTLEIYRVGACSRQEYWESRASLVNLLRPNRGGPLTLTVQTPNGSQRSLLVRADPGFIFPPTPPTENNWSVQEQIDLIAHSPFWFNPSTTDLVSTGFTDTRLVFPIDFPIEFGLNGRRFRFNQTYRGNWESFPIFKVLGPYTNAIFVNNTTGAQFQLMLPILDGEDRFVDLTPGQQSIYDSDGVSHFGELSPDSDLVNFSLQPDPVVPDGIQQIEVILSGASIASTVELHYAERFFGI